MATLMDIYNFADKYLSLFSSLSTRDSDLELSLMNDCQALDFDMSLGHDLTQQFPEIYTTPRSLEQVVHKIHDPLVLGAAIYCQWRFVTHWAECSLLHPRYRSWFTIALKRLLALSDTRNGMEDAFSGNPTKLQLVSYANVSSPCHQQETEQHLTIADNGRVWLSGYRNSPVDSTPILLRTTSFSIPPRDAQTLLSLVGGFFSSNTLANHSLDKGKWALAITNHQGITYFYGGGFTSDITYQNMDISMFMRQHLRVQGLLCFGA